MPICRGPALAGSRGYPRDEGVGERRHMRRALIGPSLRERERERERDRQTDRPDRGAAGSGRVWQCFIFYRGFYTLS